MQFPNQLPPTTISMFLERLVLLVVFFVFSRRTAPPLQTPSLRQPSTRQRLCRVPHSAKVSRQRFYRQKFLCRVLKIDTRQSLCRVPDTRQSWNRKKPEKMGIFTQKNGNFLIDWGLHRPAPAYLWHFSLKFRSNAADGIRTPATRPTGFEPATSHCAQTSSTTTPHCLVSGFRFSSQHIILNRV